MCWNICGALGAKVASPKVYRKAERRLKRLQRRVSRAQKTGHHQQKARKRLARQHQRVRHQRNNFLHKLSLSIIQQHDTICIEDLNVQGVVKTKRAKSFADAAVGSFARMLDDKAQ